MTELETATTDELVAELFKRSSAGVILLMPVASDRNIAAHFRYWGDRYACLGLIEQAAFDAKTREAWQSMGAPDEEDE